MTTKSELPLLATMVRVLGVDLERDLPRAWERSFDWEERRTAPTSPAGDEPCACGHSPESHVDDIDVCTFKDWVPSLNEPGEPVWWECACTAYKPAPRDTGAEDRRDESKLDARASLIGPAYRRAVEDLRRAALEVRHLQDVLIPPNPALASASEPETVLDVVLEGYCASCWRNGRQLVEREKRPGSSFYYYKDYCRFCGGFLKEHGIEPTRVIVLTNLEPGKVVTERLVASEVAQAKALAKGAGRKKGTNKKGRMVA